MSWGSDRLELSPWGLEGGGNGGRVSTWLENPNGTKEALPSKVTREIAPGSKIVLRTAGGGGYGPPAERDPEAVKRDIAEGFISEKRAKTAYGSKPGA